jgi:hypothetical protein
MSKKPEFDLDGFRLDPNDVESMNRAYHDARAKAAARQKRGNRSATKMQQAARSRSKSFVISTYGRIPKRPLWRK